MATCKDCVHVEVCCSFLSTAYNKCKLATPDFKLLKNIECDECQHFKDRSRFVELPCKVGDTVFVVEKIAGEWKIIKDHIETIGIGYYADGVSLYQFDGIKIDGYFEDFGKTVFLTKEEAEAALKERENNA